MNKKSLSTHVIKLESKTLSSFMKLGYTRKAAVNMKKLHKNTAKNIRKFLTKIKNNEQRSNKAIT